MRPNVKRQRKTIRGVNGDYQDVRAQRCRNGAGQHRRFTQLAHAPPRGPKRIMTYDFANAAADFVGPVLRERVFVNDADA